MSNRVSLQGKLSRLSKARYSPSGKCFVEAILAVPQEGLDRKSMGYFNLVFSGELAEEVAVKFRVGAQISILGSLWNRRYRDRLGTQKEETKIVVETLGEV